MIDGLGGALPQRSTTAGNSTPNGETQPSARVRIRVEDPSGKFLQDVYVDEGYSPGDPIYLHNGEKVSLDDQALREGGTFRLDTANAEKLPVSTGRSPGDKDDPSFDVIA